MKTVVIFLMTFLFCQILNGQKLRIEIINKTGYDLDSVSIGDKFVGKLKKNAKKSVKHCKEIEIASGGFLVSDYDAIIKNKNEDGRFRGYCGVGLRKITNGRIIFNVTVVENEYGYRLFWKETE